ncbi:MAG TPA: hypothetical protein VGL58_19365 [Caulobacteraceae bacterium]|jgi:hypothetical protein
MKTAVASLAAITALSLAAPQANAGCVTGAIVGGVAGHIAHHHALAGAAVGCIVGHELALKKKREHEAELARERAAHEHH